MRILFDTNVVLDVLLNRQPHAVAAVHLVAHAERKRIEGLLGATTITTIHYLATKAVGTTKARKHLQSLLAVFGVAAVDAVVLTGALGLPFPDFEDAVLHESARHAGADGIVTRDAHGFAKSTLRVYAPEQLLRMVEATPE